MSDKRFQECNWLEKVWRYRFYFFIPFKYIWYQYIKPFKVCKDEVVDGKLIHTKEFDIEKGKNLWRLLIGIAQSDMNWTYTHEEVMKRMGKYFKDYDNGVH